MGPYTVMSFACACNRDRLAAAEVGIRSFRYFRFYSILRKACNGSLRFMYSTFPFLAQSPRQLIPRIRV